MLNDWHMAYSAFKPLLLLSSDLWGELHAAYGSGGGVYYLHCFRRSGAREVVTTSTLSRTPGDLERKTLDVYCQAYGEPPPLNRMD